MLKFLKKEANMTHTENGALSEEKNNPRSKAESQ